MEEKTKVIGKKPFPVPLCPLLAWGRIEISGIKRKVGDTLNKLKRLRAI